MVKPGQESNEVFDLMDLFATAFTLAGVSSRKLPNDRHDDFVDQTSFLLHDDGKSKHGASYFGWGAPLIASRMREYKAYVKVVLPQSIPMLVDLATVQDVGLAPRFFNLYVDPKKR